jgi:hypothetical protein
MRKIPALAAVALLTLSATIASAATAPARCHDAKGKFVKCPMAAATPASAVKAKCKDGFAWSGKQRAGACSGHKGVASWG